MTEGRGPELGREDVAAVLGLLLCGAVVGWPLWTGAWATYLDNPSHVAELLALSRGELWHTQAFLGFPVHLLHSPLAYGSLATLVAGGLPVGLVYCGGLFAGLCAPALAIFAVARRRWPVLPSALLSTLVLLHPNALSGYSATTGGMWTFNLASAGFVLLMERVSRPGRGARDIVPLGLLLGLVASLHPMLAVCSVLLAAVSVGFRLGRPRELLRALPHELAAAGLGALLSSGYWLPSLLSGQGLPTTQQSLATVSVLLRLCLPTNLDDLWRRGPSLDASGGYLDAVPMLLLVGLGLLGAARGTAPLVRLAGVFGAVLLAVLLFVTPNVQILALGPLTWRLISVVQLTLAVTATGLDPRWIAPRRGPALALALAASALSSVPLARAVPSSAEVAEVERVWSWLAEHRRELDGRLYLQSTLGTPPLGGGLANSQILARTFEETGVDQVGAWYGISPYPTGRWTPGEFGRLFRQPLTDKGLRRITEALTRAACSHVLTSSPEAAEVLAKRPRFVRIHEEGRFTLFRFEGDHDRVVSMGERTKVTVRDRGPEERRIEVGTGEGLIVLSEAWHPFWVLEGRGQLKPTKDGMMGLWLPGGWGIVTLRYRAPLEVGWLGWVGLALAGAGWVARRRYTSNESNVPETS